MYLYIGLSFNIWNWENGEALLKWDVNWTSFSAGFYLTHSVIFVESEVSEKPLPLIFKTTDKSHVLCYCSCFSLWSLGGSAGTQIGMKKLVLEIYLAC